MRPPQVHSYVSPPSAPLCCCPGWGTAVPCPSPREVLARALALCWQVTLRQALAEPKIQVACPKQLPRSRSLHAAFQALHTFRREQGRLPRPRAVVSPRPAAGAAWQGPPAPCPRLSSPLCLQADAERVLELARNLGAQQGPLDEDVIRAFTSVSAGDLAPVAAVVGAVAAQEALKVSGTGSRALRSHSS